MTGMLPDGHSKKLKMDSLNYPINAGGSGGNVIGSGVFTSQMQSHSDFQGFPTGSSGGGGIVGATASNNVKIEQLQAEMEAQTQQLHGQAASPLPPFSQIRRQGNQPYSPATAQFPDGSIGIGSLGLKNHMGADANLVDPGNTPGIGIKVSGLHGSAMDTPDGQDMEDIQGL